MSEEMIPVHPQDPMIFACTSENSCFNSCCRDLSQALTPYDVLRLKNSLGISSQEFLRSYTSRHTGPGTGLPILEFKPNPATGHACPFVTDLGCSVYEDRPGSCRLYPLARAIARSRETGKIQEYFALIEEPHCQGFGQKTNLTVAQWVKGQKVSLHNFYNDKLMELISLKNQIMPGKLSPKESDLFYLALYDLDEFRSQILEQDLFAELSFPCFSLSSCIDAIKTSDEALLDIGIQWVKYMFFGMDMEFSHDN